MFSSRTLSLVGSMSLSGRRQASLQRRHPHHYSTPHLHSGFLRRLQGLAHSTAGSLSSSSYLLLTFPTVPSGGNLGDTELTGSDAQQSLLLPGCLGCPIPTPAELSEAACHKSLGLLQMQTLGSHGFTSRWHLSSPSSTEEAVPMEHELF